MAHISCKIIILFSIIIENSKQKVYICIMTLKYDEAKHRFIQQWGALGSAWGISRTMAQIQAVLLLSPEPMTADDLMEELGISRGNVSMSLKSLIDWGVATKEFKAGERKEYFKAEKDIYRVATQVAHERRKRELEPVLHMLESIKDMDDQEVSKSKREEMKKVGSNILDLAKKSDSLLKKFISAEKNWFLNKIMKL